MHLLGGKLSIPYALEKFKDTAKRFHSSYHLANIGLSKLAEIDYSDEKISGGKTQTLFDVESGQVISEFPLVQLRAGMKLDGPISQIVAHGILCWIFVAWNDNARKEIALELGVSTNQVQCDVMGDIRIIRNAIAHDFATLGKDVEKLKELTWFKFRPGRLVLTSSDMGKIQLAINKMTIRIKEQD